MPQDVTLYKLLISCPGDIKDEIDIINSAVSKFNELYSATLGITIQTKHWSKSSYAQSGDKPQTLLNQQFVKDCDAAVAIFWTRFGTPTDNYGSGTEEEIELMLNSDKQVFLYFSDKQISPSSIDSNGYNKIQEFRAKYSDRGLYSTYTTNEEFKELFFAHLSQHFLSIKRISEIQTKRTSSLKLCCIDDNNDIKDNFITQKFVFNTDYTIDRFISDFRELTKKVEQINVADRTPYIQGLFPSLSKPIEIEEDEKKRIIDVANILNVAITDNFFKLGNLEQNQFSGDFLSGGTIEGTDDEKRKYWLIRDLGKMATDMVLWFPIEDSFKEMTSLKLALQNHGTDIDEDVEVSLIIPKSVLLLPNEFPKLQEYSMKYIINSCNAYDLFGINDTAYINNYESSQKEYRYATPQIQDTFPSLTRSDYGEQYERLLNNVFFYSIFSDGDNYVVKLTFDYIKHNTVVAFPTVLLVKDDPKQILYKITSKHNPNVVEGILTEI